MKVLVTFSSHKNKNFEGARMRKTIKGALELNNIDYATNIIDVYDVAHFMSVEEETKMMEISNKNLPIIVSALYSENDENASFIVYKNIKGKPTFASLKSKALKTLNKADLVLVPTESAKKFLEINGVKTKINVILPGINLARFNFSRDDEKELFYRYYKEDKNKKLVIGVGEYTSENGITTFIDCARACPDAVFYYFGCENKEFKSSFKLKRLIKNAPKNVHFNGLAPEDIYRSALLNASVLLIPGYQCTGVTSLQDAMAAKCQLIVRSQAVFPEIIENQVTGYTGQFSETLVELTKGYLLGEIKPTIDNAYKYINDFSLREYGEKLEQIYTKQIELKKGEYRND